MLLNVHWNKWSPFHFFFYQSRPQVRHVCLKPCWTFTAGRTTPSRCWWTSQRRRETSESSSIRPSGTSTTEVWKCVKLSVDIFLFYARIILLSSTEMKLVETVFCHCSCRNRTHMQTQEQIQGKKRVLIKVKISRNNPKSQTKVRGTDRWQKAAETHNKTTNRRWAHGVTGTQDHRSDVRMRTEQTDQQRAREQTQDYIQTNLMRGWSAGGETQVRGINLFHWNEIIRLERNARKQDGKKTTQIQKTHTVNIKWEVQARWCRLGLYSQRLCLACLFKALWMSRSTPYLPHLPLLWWSLVLTRRCFSRDVVSLRTRSFRKHFLCDAVKKVFEGSVSIETTCCPLLAFREFFFMAST